MPPETLQINIRSIYLFIAVIAFLAPALIFLWRAGRAWERIGAQINTVAIAQTTAASLHQSELQGVNQRLDKLNGATAENRADTGSALQRISAMEGREATLGHSHTPVTPHTPPT